MEQLFRLSRKGRSRLRMLYFTKHDIVAKDVND